MEHAHIHTSVVVGDWIRAPRVNSFALMCRIQILVYRLFVVVVEKYQPLSFSPPLTLSPAFCLSAFKILDFRGKWGEDWRLSKIQVQKGVCVYGKCRNQVCPSVQRISASTRLKETKPEGMQKADGSTSRSSTSLDSVDILTGFLLPCVCGIRRSILLFLKEWVS